jgi:hypothetical protein
VACHFWNSFVSTNPWTFGSDVVGFEGRMGTIILRCQNFTPQQCREILSPQTIYQDPFHYAGWFLKQIVGNLFLNGSVIQA